MPLYDYKCQHCHQVFESTHKMDEYLDGYPCPICEGFGKRIITKMPLRSYLKRPQDRLWGTSHISSSEKFKEKQKRKGGKK